MVIDTGLPLSVVRDLLQMAAAHVDFWKFGFGSAGVCTPEVVWSKVSLCQEYGVLPYPGGTSMEIAIQQGVWQDYLESMRAAGLRVVEVSDGTITLQRSLRQQVISAARKMGFTVLTEVGKKRAGTLLPIAEQAELIRADLDAGAAYVLIEGRENGLDVGFFEADGRVRMSEVDALTRQLGPSATRVIWEAPRRAQQILYIERFGNRVNLGNVQPFDIVPLESLRRGLRSDTFALGLPPERDVGASAAKPLGKLDEPAQKPASAGGPTVWKRDEHGPSQGKPFKST